MGVLCSSSQPAERLLVGVESAYGSGDFQVDERLRVEEIHQRSDGGISTATISVRIDDEFDSEEARRRYQPDRRIAVMTDEATPSQRTMLFEGYVPVQSSRWDGRIGKEDERYIFEAEHVFERLTRDRDALIYGRHVRNGVIEDGLLEDPDSYADKSVQITSLPCVFNPDGVPNRAEQSMTVTSPVGEPLAVHLFTWEGDCFAVKWTYATALRYLIWFYLLKEGPVHAGNIFSVTGKLIDGITDSPDALCQALLREPVSLVCETINLAEALSLLAAAAGIHISADTSNQNGQPVTQLRIWVADDGPVRPLYLVRGGYNAEGEPRYDTADRSVSQILSENNTYKGQVTWDHRGIVNCPVVIGDIKRYEMTVPLWPGWLPRYNLDDVTPNDRESAKALVLTPAQVTAMGNNVENNDWFRHYHRRGSEFRIDADVSRLWVLNEDGFYEGALYNRNEPFDHYGPFDFSTVADSMVTTNGAWLRRRRRLLPVISTSSDGRPLGVWVEVSFDSGNTWQQQSSGVRILEDRAGIYFDCENPAEITPAGIAAEEQNMWYAIIDQTFRVRVTAVVESDERLISTFPADRLDSPTLRTTGMIVRRPQSYRYVTRSHTTNVLKSETSAPAGERDDTTAIELLAEQLARTNQDRRVRVAPTIPWIETGYAIGDRISEIRGRNLRFDTTIGCERRWPAVLERRFVLREGRYETELILGTTDLPEEAV